MPIWGVVNQKGGVGKTTTAVNLAAGLALRGAKTLLIDCDPQGNATTGLGVDKSKSEATLYDVLLDTIDNPEAPTTVHKAIHEVRENLHLIPATLDLAGAEPVLLNAVGKELILRDAIDAIRDRYDWIILDAPPSLGLLTINILSAADAVLVPMQCEFYALEGLSQLLKTIDVVRKRINPGLRVEKVLLTMYDPRNRLTQQVTQEVRDYFGTKVSPVVVPRNVRLSESPSFGEPAMTRFPSSKGASAYAHFVDEVLRECAEQFETVPLEVAVESIQPNLRQPRHFFDPVALDELASSIREFGVLQPLLVRPLDEGSYELIAGERRLRAAKQAGLKTVPVIIRPAGNQTSLEMALIENVQREDINALECARAYRRLIDEFGLTQEQVADKVGKSRTAVANTVRILRLPQKVQEGLEEGRITEGHARALLAFETQEQQLAVYDQILERGLTVREVEKAAKPKPAPSPRKDLPQDDPNDQALTESLSIFLGSPVKINRIDNGGKLIVDFYSEEDLERILDILGFRF